MNIDTPLEEAVWNLMAAMREFDRVPSEETERLFRHAIRLAVRFPAAREEVADTLSVHRELLSEEFGCLWPADEGRNDENGPGQSLSRRELVARILRRMKGNGQIGAVHAPFVAAFSRGLPDHQRGLGTKAGEMLIQHGVIRCKPTGIGPRVSIEPAMIPEVDRLIGLDPCSLSTVEEWIGKE